ncbi:glycosyltransferase [Hoeflea sp.]|uniref:glycosyltransferase n=1 Tax=Hoeflea sp. TaxID=1940281 RepID=UPI0019A70FC9|nr:glycosyltransferase [Hoeflea sp.]MBC7284756.1 glycosyltransferase [Hoeflea sp.]
MDATIGPTGSRAPVSAQATQARADPLAQSILHVTEAPLGGVVAYLEEMLAGQIADGRMDIGLVTPEINLPALNQLAGERFTAFPLPAYRRKSLLSPLRLARETIRQARRTRPDILHVHSTIAGAIVRACRPFLPRETAVIYCPHGWAFSRKGGERVNAVVRLVERLLARGCDSIVCISEPERQEALSAGLPADKLVVIENGVSARTVASPAATKRPAGSPRRMVFAGRFDRQKGFDTYLEVMRRLGPEAEGIAIGRQIVSGDKEPELPANVTVTGWIPRGEVYELYAGADVLLVPSRWEGFGLVAVEAMQARLPVFASRVGGLRDIVEDGITGRFFEPDDVEAIVSILRSTTDAELRAFGEAGYARYLARYTADRMNRRMLAHYESLIATRRGA